MHNIQINPSSVSANMVTINLPLSKSISNRSLIIDALTHQIKDQALYADCKDSNALYRCLTNKDGVKNIGDAGTAMRFLCSYLSIMPGEWELTGSERMKERPIGGLVNALRQLGADIEYIDREGYPPLKIKGKKLIGGRVDIDRSASSQFVTSLMLIAPMLECGLQIHLQGQEVSSSYIQMTQKVMEQYGAIVRFEEQQVCIDSIPYQHAHSTSIEGDWSGASYLFAIEALSKRSNLRLYPLTLNSMQGDSKQVELWQTLGIEIREHENSVIISAHTHFQLPEKLTFDFNQMPDLVQTFTVACCMLNVPFHFTGVSTLQQKECKRIDALCIELQKFGYHLKTDQNQYIAWDGNHQEIGDIPLISTYNDHRMAMSFSAIAFAGKALRIEHPEVVGKSFPTFWQEIKKLGAKIQSI